MKDAVFAQNPTDIAAFNAQLNACMHGSDDAVQWAMLIDDAFDHGKRRFPDTPGQVNLYQAAALEGLATVAPRLVPLQRDEDGQRMLRRALQHCSGRPMLSVLACRSSLQHLHMAWDPLHWVQTEDGQALLLRFADTRVLPVLPRVLHPGQWALLVGPLEQWVHVSRDGLPALCEASSVTAGPERQIALTNDQIGALIAAAEPDAMQDYMFEHLPDVMPEGTTPLQCYRWAADTHRLATDHGIDAWADRIALLCAHALTQGDVQGNPALERLLAARDWPQGQLGQALLANELV
ncbi:hypothetical protein D3C86_972080 [compost metagenome]